MQNLKKEITLPLILSFFLLSGCANKNPDDPYKNLDAQLIYNSGLKNLKKYRYEEAVNDFEALESHYPFGEYTDKSQLAAIYAHYKQNEFAEALAKAERFIRVHPRHEHVVYAYYMKGLVHFAESIGFVAKYLPMERSERDSKAAEEAFDAFNLLIEKFPNSCYVPEAKKRLVYLYTVISENELHAARYYLKRKAYIAAANRASTILERFPQSYIREEALFIQIQAYRKLCLFALANDSLSVLKLNYPNSLYLGSL